MLVFARIGAMVMLLPGLGEANIPVRIKLSIALLLTLIILPLHRAAYHVDMDSIAPMLVLMVHEIIIGIVLGATARVTLRRCRSRARSSPSRWALASSPRSIRRRASRACMIGNFLTMLGMTLLFATDRHYLVIAALSDSYTISRRAS